MASTYPGRSVLLARRAARRAAIMLAAMALALSAAVSPAEPDSSAKTGDSQHFRATSHRRFADVEHWKKIFDDPARDAWQKPELVVNALGIAAGDTVADLGAGTGYFSARLSAAVGEQGRVLSVEVEPNLVAQLRDRAQNEGSDNLMPILASLDNPRLPAASVDLILIVDTIHHLDKRRDYFERLNTALSERGRIAIIDWKKQAEIPVGPPPAHRLARDQVLSEMTTLGYTLIGEPNILPYQYFLIFERP